MGLSLCLVGLGQFGMQWAELFRQHPLVDRFAVCDVDPARVAAACKAHDVAQAYASLEEVLASDVQAVVLITQPWLHHAQAIQALRAGKHVYSAVPAAYGADGNALLDACDELVRTVTQTGLVYMVGETTIYRSQVLYCGQRAAAGDFGELTYGECEYWHDLDSRGANLREVYKNRWGSQWGPDKWGGIPMHYPTHSTASMVQIMGAHMVSVSAQGYVMPNEEFFLPGSIWGNTMSNEVALYRMSSGTLVRHTEMRRIGHRGREGFRLFGTEACFLWDVSGCKWTTLDGWEPVEVDGARPALPEPLASNLGGHGGSHAYLAHEFVSACCEDRIPLPSVWDAVRYLAPGIVAHQSALRDGEPMAIPDWGDPPR